MTKQEFIKELQNNTIYYFGSRCVNKTHTNKMFDLLKTLTPQQPQDNTLKRQVTKIGSNHIIFNNKNWLHFDANKNYFYKLDNNLLVYTQEYHDQDTINFIVYQII